MRHSQTFLDRKKELEKRESEVKQEIDSKSFKIQAIIKYGVMALILLFVVRIFYRLFSRATRASSRNSGRKGLIRWSLERLVEGGIYYLLTRKK